MTSAPNPTRRRGGYTERHRLAPRRPTSSVPMTEGSSNSRPNGDSVELVLHAQHAALIHDSAISDPVAKARGYRTITQPGGLTAAGFSDSQLSVPALLIPVHSVNGDVQLYQARPDEPRLVRGKALKYETPRGAKVILDVPPMVRESVVNTNCHLWITEGIRKADAAASLGLACVGLTGVWNWCRGKDHQGKRIPLPDWDRIPLRGRRAYVVFDSDVMEKRSVRQALEGLLEFLRERGAEPRPVYLPDGPEGQKVGLDDFLAAGHGEHDLLERASLELRDEASVSTRTPIAKRLVEQALSTGAEFFHTPAGDAYATVAIGDHRETMPLDSRAFKRWLGRMLHDEGNVASAAQLTDATTRLEATAIYDGAEHLVHVRIAGDDEVVYIDLGDEAWRVIEVRSTGWRLLDDPPVKFRRTPAMQPLPEPQPGGSVDLLRAYINVPDDRWSLLLGWSVVALMPCGGYPLLVLHGEQGTAKSTTAKLLRALIDPARPALRAEPDTINNLMVAANNNWVLAYDNLSNVTPQLSDALCRISTGGGHAVRALYTNNEETLFDAQRPMVLTGIDAIPRRPDLLERALLVELPRIAPSDRQTERSLWASFDAARPKILGALLEGVASALDKRSATHLTSLPRMAEFAELATASEPGLGLPRGAVMDAYDRNQHDATGAALDASPLWPALDELADGVSRTAGELLAALLAIVDEPTARRRGWPGAPHILSNQIKRLAPNLASIGIKAEYGSTGRGNERRNTITISKSPAQSAPTAPSRPSLAQDESLGAHGDASTGMGALPEPDGGAWGRSGDALGIAEQVGDSGMGALGALGAPASKLELKEPQGDALRDEP